MFTTGNGSSSVLPLNSQSSLEDVLAASGQRLVELTRRMLRQYRSLRRWEETDDVFQNAMLRLHRALVERRDEPVRNFWGLAATHIRWTLIDLARGHFGPEGAAAHHHSDGAGLLEEAANRDEPATVEAWSRFHQLVQELPEEERQVVDLLWYHGVDQAEAATIVGVNVRTIKRRWQRARLLLRAGLDGEAML